MTDLVSSFIRNIWGSDKPKKVKEELKKVKEQPKEVKEEPKEVLEKPKKLSARDRIQNRKKVNIK